VTRAGLGQQPAGRAPRHGPAFASALAALLIASPAARADEIRTAARARYASVRIEDVREGRLFFRDVQGRLLNRPLADVAGLHITGWEPFNRAEAALEAGQYRQAARELESLLRAVEQDDPPGARPRHRRQLLTARLLLACDGEGRFDRAVECWLALCREWTTGAAALAPKNVPPKESAFFATALGTLDAAMSEAGATPFGDVLREYRARLLAPPATQPVAKPTASNSPATAPAPVERSSSHGDGRLRLVEDWVGQRRYDQALRMIAERLRTEPRERLAPWYYWHARCLDATATTDEASKDAALEYMRVVVLAPEDPLAAECLYRTAMIHRRLNLEARVRPLLEEALRRSPGPALRKRCEAELARESR